MTKRLSRRAFLAMAGAAGIAAPGLGSAGGLAARGSWTVPARPAWVETAARPKMRLDDSTYARFDKRRCVFPTASGGSLATYVGPEAERAMLQASGEAVRRLARRAGFRSRDWALLAAARTVSDTHGGPNSANRGLLSWTSDVEETHRVDEWADARLAARDVKAAARFLGAALVGIARLDPRHVYSHDLDGKAIVFEDVAVPSEDEHRRVIPSRCRTVVVYAVRMSSEAVKRAPTAIASATANMTYSQLTLVGSSLATFLRTTGYLAIPCINDTAVSIPLAVEAGLGELARHNRLITPEYGPLIRLGKVLTDLPMEVDSPVDAGIREFCRSCAKCAEACPSGAISSAPEPTFTPRGPWNSPGHEAWFEDSVKCYSYLSSLHTNCMICFSVCPFSKKSRAAIHSLVKATVSRTDALNGVIRSIDDAFGYGGQKSPDGWWELDLPTFGVD